VAYSNKLPYAIIVDHYAESKMSYDNMVSKIRFYDKKYNLVTTVMDPSPGAQLISDIRRQYSLPIKAAEKRDKMYYVDMMAEQFKNGFIKVEAQLLDFINNLKLLTWTKERREILGAKHYMDSTLYALRESQHYQYKPPQPEKPLEDRIWDRVKDKMEINKNKKYL
jgi:hypothetical protein